MRTNRDKQREVIAKFMEYFKIDVNGLTEKFGVTAKNAPGWLAGYYDPILLYRNPIVSEAINAEWLLTGEGEMLKKEPSQKNDDNSTIIEMLKKENTRLEESLQRAESRYDKLLEKFLDK